MRSFGRNLRSENPPVSEKLNVIVAYDSPQTVRLQTSCNPLKLLRGQPLESAMLRLQESTDRVYDARAEKCQNEVVQHATGFTSLV